jgi:exodeoxyribonuclease VII small subunit
MINAVGNVNSTQRRWTEAACLSSAGDRYCVCDLALGPKLLYLAKYFSTNVSRPLGSSKMSFESNLARLEEIVAQLEGDRLDLNAALGLFEEGIELLRLASSELNETETRVKELIERADGVLELRDLGS